MGFAGGVCALSDEHPPSASIVAKAAAGTIRNPAARIFETTTFRVRIGVLLSTTVAAAVRLFRSSRNPRGRRSRADGFYTRWAGCLKEGIAAGLRRVRSYGTENQMTANGGISTAIECENPCHGIAAASTPPMLPALEPPYAAASVLRISR